MPLMPTMKTIKTKQAYTFEEVLATLEAEAKLPAKPFVHQVFGLKAIYIPGVGPNDVSIAVSKKKITVSEAAHPSIKNFLVDQVTDGWSTIGGRAMTNIKDIVLAVADEVQRLFGE